MLARWLARDLAAVDRSRTPWVLVTFHNPWRAPRMHMAERGRCPWVGVGVAILLV